MTESAFARNRSPSSWEARLKTPVTRERGHCLILSVMPVPVVHNVTLANVIALDEHR